MKRHKEYHISTIVKSITLSLFVIATSFISGFVVTKNIWLSCGLFMIAGLTLIMKLSNLYEFLTQYKQRERSKEVFR